MSLNFNKNITTIIAVLTICFTFSSYAHGVDTLHHTIHSYFAERLKSADEEQHLIPFEGKRTIKNNEIPAVRAAVWQQWKKQLLSYDSLPAAIEPQPEELPPLYQWELKKENPMPFYFIRKGDGRSKTHAMFLNLHGSGPKAHEFRNTFAWTMRYEDRPSIYFIPQIPSEQRYRWWFKPVQYAWERLFRLAMIQEGVDPNRLYVMGISEGGYGSQRLAAFYADYLAGAGPMAGGEPLQNAPPLNFRHIAFSLQTGENDRGFGRNTLTNEAKLAFGKLAAENPGEFIHKIELQPNRGHGIDYTVTTPWLIHYNRNPHPKHISWVLFPMDGRYRKAFYNIALNRPLDIREGDEFDRAVFEIRYQGNTVYITAELMDSKMESRKKLSHLDMAIFLDSQYVDLKKKVKVVVNDKVLFHNKIPLNLAHMVESCAIFGDPERVFPAKIDVRL